MNFLTARIVILLAALSLTARAAPANPQKEEVARLIYETDYPSVLIQARELVLHPEHALGPDDVDNARARIAKAKENVPKLRKLIKLKTSVFDYPGLLARGLITYHNATDPGEVGSYRLWVSADYAGHQMFVQPHEFELYFDDSGIITDVRDVQWKH